MGEFSFGKNQRLSRKKIIELLFEKGRSRNFFPLKLICLPHPSPEGGNQVLITVPSRTFKKAVTRNTLKRRIREGYRLNRAALPPTPPWCLAYIYVARETMPSASIHEAVRASLHWINAS